MKKKLSKRSVILIVIIIAAVIVFALWVIGSQNPPIPDPPNTITLSQGTQMHYGDLFIGLGSVNRDSAWLMINKDGSGQSTREQVHAGDKIDIYGYKIEVSSVKETFNPSPMPGSSHGYVKFIITKQ